MENRSIVKVLILSIVTFGIYSIVWHFWTTKELKAKGADIPTAWLQIIPLANIYFYFKYYEGAEKVTGGAVSGILYFVLALFVSPIISMLLAQNEFNKLGGSPSATANTGGQPVQPAHQQDATSPHHVADQHASAAAPAPSPAPADPSPAPASQPAHQPAQPAAPMQDVGPTAPSAPAPAATPQQDPAPTGPDQQQPPQNPPLVQ